MTDHGQACLFIFGQSFHHVELFSVCSNEGKERSEIAFLLFRSAREVASTIKSKKHTHKFQNHFFFETLFVDCYLPHLPVSSILSHLGEFFVCTNKMPLQRGMEAQLGDRNKFKGTLLFFYSLAMFFKKIYNPVSTRDLNFQ